MSTNGPRRIITGLAVAAAALVAAGAASAHARVSPPVSLAKELQLYSLAVPTEKANLTTTKPFGTVCGVRIIGVRSSKAGMSSVWPASVTRSVTFGES